MRHAVLAAVLLAAAGPLAARAEPLPPPAAGPPGVIRIWGNPGLAPALARWTEGFRRSYPGTRIEAHLTGSDVGLAALYSGKADIALVGREAGAMEAKAFQWVYGYPPTGVPIARGSLDQPGRSPALAVLVHRGNPVRRISRAALRKLFTTSDDTAGPHTWRELGATGAWANRPIHLYAPDAESGSGRFFRHVVLEDSNSLNWPALREFDESPTRTPHPDRLWARIAAALARDPDGLALGLEPAPGAPVRALALSDGPAEPFATPAASAYPLARQAYAYVNRPPHGPDGADVDAFLRYALSAGGQDRLGSATGYRPLSPGARAAALAQLGNRSSETPAPYPAPGRASGPHE